MRLEVRYPSSFLRQFGYRIEVITKSRLKLAQVLVILMLLVIILFLDVHLLIDQLLNTL